jgi:hypothetical protein
VALLTTTGFEQLARMQARALGDEELEMIVVQHPIGGIGAAALHDRCDDAAGQALSWFASELARRSRR